MASNGTLYPFETLRELKEIVAEYGPDTTRQCTYTKEDEAGALAPHCIVGVFLSRHGITVDTLSAINGEPVESHHTRDVLETHGVNLDPQSAAILQTAQEHQDSGEPWAEAIKEAEVTFHNGERSYYYSDRDEQAARDAEVYDYDDDYYGEDN